MHVCLCEYKHCKNYPLFWLIFMQVASTEWFLGVHIQHFENQYNAEIINGKYCCCHDDEICSSDLSNLLVSCTEPSTTQLCETYFVVHIKNCIFVGECSLSKTYQLNYKFSASVFDHGILSIPFMEMELGDMVRTKIRYICTLIKGNF